MFSRIEVLETPGILDELVLDIKLDAAEVLCILEATEELELLMLDSTVLRISKLLVVLALDIVGMFVALELISIVRLVVLERRVLGLLGLNILDLSEGTVVEAV